MNCGSKISLKEISENSDSVDCAPTCKDLRKDDKIEIDTTRNKV